MDAKTDTLIPAMELARENPIRILNESAEYRAARTALLAQEIELRRQIERVAALRRALPPGGPVTGDYRFVGEEGPVGFKDLFAGKPTLITYNYMFGPERERPCPMCTNLLDSWDGVADDVAQQASLVVIARSSIERLAAWKKERGWKNLRLYSDGDSGYSRAYGAIAPDGGDIPAINVFTRREGTIRHFWSGEMGGGTADPGQDPRGAPDPSPLWTILDMTPQGRPRTWYPSLGY